MERIRFSCSECRTTLGVNADMAGKTIKCPKCGEKTVVTAANEESTETSIRFPCTKCGTKLKVAAKMTGRGIPCPRCGENTVVPDPDEGGSYGLAETSHTAEEEEIPKEEPISKWWPDGDKVDLPMTWRTALASARDHTEDGKWTKALDLLNDLYQKGLSSKSKNLPTHILRKPLAYCLVRWTAREIDRLEDDRAKLSKPIRQVLKKAADMKRWNGTLSYQECPLCSRQLRQLIGTTQVRTVAGSAYLCCARPTADDEALVQKVDRMNKKLVLASMLDPDNRHVPIVMKNIPEWYRALDVYQSKWTRKIVDDDDGRNAEPSGGGIFGAIAGDATGQAVGNLLSSLLFG